ncbi:protein required for cell viability [Paecilomyces variotii No. 5]|uniref:Protein required for cell viability n=1 Tax=Byssochlamys spectabilis (strain No. 5 / NBRC 109023) TaxID=1356009 RepID=V5FM36_BYSSN|nr:protein required for cell viability [Paecilomyces variotii No. 5]
MVKSANSLSEEIQKSRGESLLQILSKKLSVLPEEENQRNAVISEALSLLAQIHTAFATSIGDDDEPGTSRETEDVALEDAKRRRILHSLLDLISLEGVYPSLSGGVGVPLEKRVISVLPAGVIAKQSEVPGDSKPRDESLLSQILNVLRDLLFDERPSIQPIIRGRILSDIISGSADLAFNARTLPLEGKKQFREFFENVIEQTPTPVLLPTLSAFLRPDTAPWFKSTISSHLSAVPLRPDGVIQTIIFVASQFAPSLGHDAQTPSSDGPPITVQAIMQTSKLLSSVPQAMDPVEYFENISPKLLALLDGDDLDMKRTAAYVVGSGILGKRVYGAPGTIGHSIFVEPIFKTLTGELDEASQRWMRCFTGFGEALPWDRNQESPRKDIVGESQIFLGIERLSTLTLQHPNPGLVKRILHPILLPLWGMACYAREQGKTLWHEKTRTLLQTFFGMSVGVPPLRKLVDNLLWDGGPTWTYGPGENEGISLQQRERTKTQQINLVQLVDSLDLRADEFVKLLGSDPQSEERTGDIFLYVSERWLVQPSANQSSLNRLKLHQDEDDSEAITRKLVSAKIAEKLLESFKDTLSRHPLRVLELVKQIIESELRQYEAQETRRKDTDSGKATLASLSNIVSRDQPDSDVSLEQSEAGESLTAAFSLLSTILASPEFSASETITPALQSVKTQLDLLIPYLPASLSKPGMTSSMLLDIHLSPPEGFKEDTKALPSHVSDLETHRQALSNLNSPLPPVQAEGLSLLSSLITKSSPVLDIASTLSLLLSLIMDTSESASNEEFIYLNVIKLIGDLASRHPRTVVKTLVERYADRQEERTLDQRLKMGEALLRTVQDLGDALTGETAKILGEGMISVAGRRSRKPEAQRLRRKQLDKERRQKEREARESTMPPGWNISGPSISELQEEDSDTETPEQTAQSANIISAWAAGAASDEDPDDLRARASAISILATAIQTNLLGLGPQIASSAVDLALSTLSLEPDPESAILRRGCVVLLLDLIKAIDETRENKGSSALGFGFSLTDDAGRASGTDRGRTIGNIPQMLRTLLFVESRETDSIVRGHIRVLIESLEAWMEKSLMWGIGARGDEEDEEPRLELGDRLAGLDINPLAGRGMGPRIEEIE